MIAGLVLVFGYCGPRLAGLFPLQVAAVHHRLGCSVRLRRPAPADHLHDRAALRHATCHRGEGDPAHDPAHSPPAGADARHRRAGGAQRAGEEGAAAVPVRPSALREFRQAAGGRAGQGQAERAGAEGRYPGQRAEGREAAGRSCVCAVPAQALHQPGPPGSRPGGGRAEVDCPGGGLRGRHPGSRGRSRADQPGIHLQHQRGEHHGGGG